MKSRKTKNRVAKTRRKADRRTLRTRDLLGDALVAILHEKGFDEITVQNVLDRSGVGRSTFYAHYRDKNDLFQGDVEDFLEKFSSMLNRHHADLKRLLPVQEFFEHVREANEFYRALVMSGKINDVRALGQGCFARSIEDRLQRAGAATRPRQSAQTCALAGSFFALLEWWIDQGMRAEPEELDAVFHRLAWKGLAARTPPSK